ncbi:MAG: CCA tRNA nucleotidyltransferase [Terriglobales bacterium]
MPASARAAAVEIIRTLREHGYQGYLVGGCVRDLLLGREPADYDVSTDARPDDVMRIFPQTWAVGAQFGVVLVPVDSVNHGTRSSSNAAPVYQPLATNHPTIEVATFRSDGLYTDGRHPDEVTYTRDPREDVRRRDFTINGLLLDPVTNQVLDYVNDQDDLRNQIIRTIGLPEQRFAEDKLRMPRAVRFAARFGYHIDAATMHAIRRLASQVAQVSRERVRDELTKMLTEGRARRAFELLDESGLLHEVLPEVEKMKGVEQPPQFHPEGDVWVHTLLMLEMLPPGASRTLAWGALLHDVGKPPTFRVAPDRIRFDSHVEVGVAMAGEIARRLRMSNDDAEQIAALVGQHMRFADALKMKPSTLKRFMRQSEFGEHMEMHRIDCLASHGDLGIYEFLRQKIEQTPPEQIRPRPLLTGHDLLEMGYRPGPRFREILSTVEDGQLEGTITTREQAVEFVRGHFQNERGA